MVHDCIEITASAGLSHRRIHNFLTRGDRYFCCELVENRLKNSGFATTRRGGKKIKIADGGGSGFDTTRGRGEKNL